MGKGSYNNKVCPICHTEFIPTNAHQWYCSPDCQKVGHNKGLRGDPGLKRGAEFAMDAEPESHADNMKRISDMVKNDPFYGQHQVDELWGRRK